MGREGICCLPIKRERKLRDRGRENGKEERESERAKGDRHAHCK